MNTSVLRVALGQFFVQPESSTNLAIVRDLIDRAQEGGAELLVLPEGIIARKPGDNTWPVTHREPIDGPFVTGLLKATVGEAVTVVCTAQIALPNEARYANDLLVVRDGKILLCYQKLHLYDAFNAKESVNAVAGNVVPALVDVGPFRCGFMTCYDIRFPEMARSLALSGATLLVVPAAWVRGPLKEMHWDINIRARALENTCYVAAVSECGPVNVGQSKLSDPYGVVVAQCGTANQLLFADIDAKTVEACRENLPVLTNRRFAAPHLKVLGEN